MPHLSVSTRWWPPDFTGIICLPHTSQCYNSSHKRKQMRIDEKCSGVSLSLESDPAKETEAYDRYVKSEQKRNKQKKGSSFWDKGTMSQSMPVFTGQFNGRRNTKTLSLTRISHVFVFPLESACVIMVSWDKCRPCGFGPISVCLWHPNVCLASVWEREWEREYVCVSVHLWREQAHNRALASLIPLAIQIHRLFSEAKNSVRRLPLTLSL